MNIKQLKEKYYFHLDCIEESVFEHTLKLELKSRNNNKTIADVFLKINKHEINQSLFDSQFSISPISFQDYFDQSVIMLFNLLIISLNLGEGANSKDELVDLFDANPFQIL